MSQVYVYLIITENGIEYVYSSYFKALKLFSEMLAYCKALDIIEEESEDYYKTTGESFCKIEKRAVLWYT